MSAKDPLLPPDAGLLSGRRDASPGVLMDGSQLLDLSRSTTRERRHLSSGVGGIARHTLGLMLLVVVVFLWTIGNFLGSTILADNTFAKPFFVTYFNTSFLIFLAIPTLVRQLCHQLQAGKFRKSLSTAIKKLVPFRQSSDESEAFLKPDDENSDEEHLVGSRASIEDPSTLGIVDTAKLSFEFCILWFLANYLAMACLQHTTVASATILTATSSVWTLIIGATTRVEKFTIRKLIGVFGALLGVVIISRLDYTTNPSDNDSTFPEKSNSEIALGDGMALLGAFIYGVYTIVLKKKVGPDDHSSKVHMPLFFGLVGLCNIVLLWPLFPILSVTGAEPFELPSTSRIWTIILVNSLGSLLSDIAWAYAMILTSPLVVTVGLSLTIPLSLVGEMIIQSQFKGWMYWVGAIVVVAGFGIVEGEEKKEELQESMIVTDGVVEDEENLLPR